VLTQLAPSGSLPDEAEFTYGPEHVHEAAVLIDAIHALHARAVNAEQEAAEFRKLLEQAAPLIHSAGVPSAPDAFSDEPEAMTEVLTPDAEVLEARRLDAKLRAYLKTNAPSPRT
jgi:hypothetical protein